VQLTQLETANKEQRGISFLQKNRRSQAAQARGVSLRLQDHHGSGFHATGSRELSFLELKHRLRKLPHDGEPGLDANGIVEQRALLHKGQVTVGFLCVATSRDEAGSASGVVLVRDA